MSRTTVIRNADWVVAWDPTGGADGSGDHVYRRGIDVAFRGAEIVHVGAGYDGPADEVVDGSGRLVIPGLVDIHSHPSSEPGNKGLNEELGSPRLGQSSLYEYMPVFRMLPEGAAHATRFAIWEMLRSGVTTFCDLSGARDGWVDEVAETGIRGVLCPMYRSATWTTGDGHSVVYDWDEAAGERGLERAVQVIDEADRHPSGRMSGMMGPSQIDTCTPALIQESFRVARERGITMQIHAAQSVVEFNEMTRRHGMTPVEWLDDLGVLADGTIVSHGIFLNDHPWLHWPQADDFGRLVRSGAGVAHCPNVFWRRGIALNHVGRYMSAGIPLGLGTDTFPHNFLHEMEIAMVAGRLMSGDFTNATTAQIFHAATVGGARAIGRDDIGRLEPGCKADIVLVDAGHPYMQPLRDPIRSLIYSAGDRAVTDVYVHGRRVVAKGEVATIDIETTAARLNEFQQITISGVRQRDWAGRSIDEMTPMVFPGGQ
ncbi:MAG TPA: amidohydrolase family protein [Thalassobaculum sp.]